MVTHKIHGHGLVAGSEGFHFVGMFGAASQILMLLMAYHFDFIYEVSFSCSSFHYFAKVKVPPRVGFTNAGSVFNDYNL